MARMKPPIVEEISEESEEGRRGKKLYFEPIREPNIYQNCGGHLIDPPDTCEYQKTAPDGAIWTDLALCFRTCPKRMDCLRYAEYKKMTMYERVADLRARGVLIDLDWI